MTPKEHKFMTDIVAILADMLADAREILDESTPKEELETTGCTRCDIEQEMYNDPTRLCPKCRRERDAD